MKFILSTFLIIFSVSLQAQNFFTNNDTLAHYFEQNKIVTFQKVQLDIESQLKQIKSLVRNNNEFESPYINRLDKSNSNPKDYISLSSLPEIPTSKVLDNLYHDKKKDIDYYMYHDGEKSVVILGSTPSYGYFPFQKNLDTRFISSFVDGKETSKTRFNFYTNIDSIKVLYSYKRPSRVDTIRLKVGALNKPNKYGITLKRYKDYGITANFPHQNNLEIIDVAGIDKNGQSLLSNVLDSYYTYNINEETLMQNLKKNHRILTTLHTNISNKKITTINDFKSSILDLKTKYQFTPINKQFIDSKNYLFQIFGYAEEVVLYIKKGAYSISEDVIAYKSKEDLEHPTYDYYSDKNIKDSYSNPTKFFYNKISNQKIKDTVYYEISYSGSNYFTVDNKEKECKRLLIDKNNKISPFDDCSGKLLNLENNGILIEYLDDYGLDQKEVKVYDEYGKLKFKNANGTPMNQVFNGSNFIVISENDKEKFMLSDYTLTDLFDNYQIYSAHRALVFKGDKCGIIDDAGNTLIPFKYKNCELISPNYLLVNKNNQQHIITSSNKIKHIETKHLLKPINNVNYAFGASVPNLNLVTYEDNSLYGIKNVDGTIIFPAKAKEIFEVGLNRIAIRLENDLIGVINENGKEIIPFKFEAINKYFSNYAILISDNEKTFTFYDYDGNIKVTHYAEQFYEIWEVLSKPTLLIDDKITIRYNGEIIERQD